MSPRKSRRKSPCFSSTVTSTPPRASSRPSTIPAGPPPTMAHVIDSGHESTLRSLDLDPGADDDGLIQRYLRSSRYRRPHARSPIYNRFRHRSHHRVGPADRSSLDRKYEALSRSIAPSSPARIDESKRIGHIRPFRIAEPRRQKEDSVAVGRRDRRHGQIRCSSPVPTGDWRSLDRHDDHTLM